MKRAAFLHTDGWAGRDKQPVWIVGETLHRYRISADQPTRLAGRYRTLHPGETKLVPKYAITLAP